MKIRLILLLILTCKLLHGQIDTVGQRTINLTNSNYVDYSVVGNQIIAVNNVGDIIKWNLIKDTIDEILHFDNRNITCIEYKNNRILLGTRQGEILEYNTNEHHFESICKIEYPIHKIYLTSTDKIYALIIKNEMFASVYSVENKQVYDKCTDVGNGMEKICFKRFLFFFYKKIPCSPYAFYIPKTSYLSPDDVIWFGYHYGEWGGGIICFNTRNNEFLNDSLKQLNKNVSCIQSIFGNKQKTYVSCGLQHFSFSGKITEFENFDSQIIYDGKIDEDTTAAGVYVGCGQYNPFNDKVYFYTHKGFYKVINTDNTGKVTKTEKIFRPELSWNREPLAIGYMMNVKQIMFLNEFQFSFLTSNNGIGIYDEKMKILKLYK